MNEKLKKFLTLSLLSSTALLLAACTPQSLLEKTPFGKGSEEPGAATTNKMDQRESPFEKEISKGSGGKLSNLLKRNENLKCTIVQEAMGESIEGTLYTDGNSIYVESTLPQSLSEQENARSYALIKEKTFYSWSDIQSEGIKMEFESIEEFENTTEEGTTEQPETQTPDAVETLEEAEYNCESWVPVDQTLLEVPEDITFMEFNMPEIGSNAQNGDNPSTEELCNVCMKIEDSGEKSACLNALGCE